MKQGHDWRVAGLTIVVASALARGEIQGSLAVLCDASNLTFLELRPAPSGLLHHFSCRFAAAQTSLKVEDAAIYSLLQHLPDSIRWVEVRKEPALGQPEELRHLLEEPTHSSLGPPDSERGLS